ncbi:MAG: hypothetical protein JNN17_19200 [Verrucomicrobiaceae bacterium]|nr:hypothetical protein [Verrucomicrobiaceae bacterium]
MHFDEGALAWHFDTWQWFLENFDGVAALRKRRLILPTREFFPFQAGNDHESALRLFEHVKALMGMADWPCQLKQIPRDEHSRKAREEGWIGDWASSGPAGLYIHDEGEITIAYQEDLLANPVHLTATMVHELCHYLLRSKVRSHPPTGWADHELHTDVMCSFMGFGIFVCNAVFDFRQWGSQGTTGWSWSRQGYLSESEHAYALALFCELNGCDPRVAAGHLKVNPLNYFGLAVDDLESRREEVLRLAATVPLNDSLPPILSVESEADGNPSFEREPLEQIVFSLADVVALGPEKPWYTPLWNFYFRLAQAQTAATWHAMELAALESLQPDLQTAILAIRFSLRCDGEGLQGAIILDEEVDVTECGAMLERTSRAYDALGDQPRAAFLRSLLPSVQIHFDSLEHAQNEGTLDEFYSPLDQDETWQGLGLLWVKGLHLLKTRKPHTLTHPA